MTKEKLDKYSRLIRDSLEYNLARDRAMVMNGLQTYRDDSVIEVTESIKIFSNVDTDIRLRLKQLNKMIDTKRLINYINVEQVPITVNSNCRKEFIGTKYLITYKVLRYEIDDSQVNKHLRTFISKALTGTKSTHFWERVVPDCKLIKLFRQGKLSWDDCVSAHNSNCGL